MGIQAVLRLDDDNRDRGQWGQPYHLLDMPIIDGLPIPSQQLRQGAAFIHQQVEAGRRVLVHCQAGVSRSVTMMLAYLIEYRGWLLPDAYRQVLIRRAVARPHPALVISLIDCYNLPYAREAAAEFDFLQEILLPIR
jgi:protein-tyrosine phosphatase